MSLLKNKKGQIDVAITIGAIIIPVVAIFGSLVFTWATISPLTDAAALAAVVSHDIASIVEVAYAVPEDIVIKYVPPNVCSFAKNQRGDNIVTCYDNRMNFSDFFIGLEVENILNPIGMIATPQRTIASETVTLDSRALEYGSTIQKISYPGFADIRDREFIDSPTIVLPIRESYIEISKKKTDLFNTLSDSEVVNPIRSISETLVELCSTSTKINVQGGFSSLNKSMSIFLPISYYLVPSGSNFALFKNTYSPNFTEGALAGPQIEILSFDASVLDCYVNFTECKSCYDVAGNPAISLNAGISSVINELGLQDDCKDEINALIHDGLIEENTPLQMVILSSISAQCSTQLREAYYNSQGRQETNTDRNINLNFYAVNVTKYNSENNPDLPTSKKIAIIVSEVEE